MKRNDREVLFRDLTLKNPHGLPVCLSRTVPKKVDITFPPGRPTADTIESLCGNQKLRPLYTVKCLPGLDYEWLAHQAKAINRIEKAFKQCCRKKQGVLNCADQKVKQETYKHKHFAQFSHSLYCFMSFLLLYFSGVKSLTSFAWARTAKRRISTVARVGGEMNDTTVSKMLLPTHIII